LQEAGKIIGLKDKEKGQIGIIEIESTSFYIKGPPALAAYAEEPVGVEIRRPSPENEVKKISSI
jgi:hypothetical protein